jgi:hypothetical protein
MTGPAPQRNGATAACRVRVAILLQPDTLAKMN